MNFWSAFTYVWEHLPTGLRKVAGAVLGIGAVLTILLLVWLGWRDGVIQERLLNIPTKDDMQQQTEELGDYKIVAVDSVVNEAIYTYDIMIRQYLSAERKLANDTILVPLLKTMKQMIATQGVLLHSARVVDARINDLPAQFDEKFERILEASDPQAQQDLNKQLLKEFRDLKNDMSEMREELKTGRRTNKKSF